MYMKLYIIESGILSNYMVKLWQFYYRKQKVMLEDVAWKQERYDDVILMNYIFSEVGEKVFTGLVPKLRFLL